MRGTFLSAIYMLIHNEEGKILLQRRQGTKLWPGFLALPAGHVDPGENAYEALVREAKEELGIEVAVEDICDVFVVNRRNSKIEPYYDVYFDLRSYQGDIKVMEPEKCSALIWCDIDNLPDDMIDFERKAIEENQKGHKFSVIDVDVDKSMSLKKVPKNE